MLGRGNSKSSNRLNRPKSMSSVHTKVESIDSDIARRDARAAATYAFARAQERNGIGVGPSRRPPEPPRCTEQGQPEHVVKRQQSIRFAGPTAVRCRQSVGTRVINSNLQSSTNPASYRPIALTSNDPVPAAYRPPSRSSSLGKVSASKVAAENFVTALAAYDEYYTREDDVASTPSSYRRVRKSRSMSIKTPAGTIFNNERRGPDRNSLQTLPPPLPNQYNQAALRAPKSMSFLRGGRDHVTPLARQDHDVAVQVARDNFLHQIQQQNIREQPSFLFRSSSRRQEKPFRRSLRDSSRNSHGAPASSTNRLPEGPNEGEHSLRYKARKASKTIKNRIKGLFRRNDMEAKSVVIPTQQIVSQMSYAASFAASASTLHSSDIDIPHPGQAIVSRVASRVPSIHAASSNQQLRSRTGSLQSLKSQSSGKSRVTSWTSSAVDNSASSRHAQAERERERQRLSIIQENGTHVSSASFNRPPLGNQFPAYPSFHRPRSSNSRLPAVPGQVDSRKVYSALMQRLEENSPKSKLAIHRTASIDSFEPPTPIPPRSSSRNTDHSRTPATIRQILQDSPNTVASFIKPNQQTLTARPQDKDDVFSSKTSINPTRSIKQSLPESHSNSNAMATNMPQRVKYNSFPLGGTCDPLIITPQLMADLNEGLSHRSGLTESRSAFFGCTGFTISRTTSPYRRALARADYNPTAVTGDSAVRHSPLRATPLPCTSSNMRKESGCQGTPNIAYTESVYSRTTSGRTPPATHSTATLMLFQEDNAIAGSTGSAVIVDRATYRPIQPTHRPAQSSADLRTWMSKQVATLENQRDCSETLNINYASPKMPKSLSQHIRERAQISSEDVEIAQSDLFQTEQPLAMVQQTRQAQASDEHDNEIRQQMSQMRPPLSVVHPNIRTQISENNENSCLTISQPKQPLGFNQPEISQFSHQTPVDPIPQAMRSTSLVKIPIPPPLPPPMVSRSSLHATPSRNSLRSVRTMDSKRVGSAPTSATKLTKRQHSQIEHSRSTQTIRSAHTPGKALKRNARAVTYTPSPNFGSAANKQFGSIGSRMPSSLGSTGSKTPYFTPYGGTENQAPSSSRPPREESNVSDSVNLMGLDFDAQIMGSRRMVDLFLSSRRRRMAGSDESNAFL